LTVPHEVLVDSNVLIDVLEPEQSWQAWSSAQLAVLVNRAALVINPIIYSEVSIAFDTLEALDEVLPDDLFRRDPLPWEAAFLAGKCFVRYRRSGGKRTSPLPDFYVGAHAAIQGMTLLTRDASRYRAYFPHLQLIAPA
jgi:predicted nucleic acid-binding protein